MDRHRCLAGCLLQHLIMQTQPSSLAPAPAESDLAVSPGIEAAISDVMAYEQAGNPSSAPPRGGARTGGLLLQAAAAAAVAACTLALM